jgi:hypothetical protein
LPSCSLRSATTTLEPAAASARTVAAPRPLAPPDTMAAVPLISMGGAYFGSDGRHRTGFGLCDLSGDLFGIPLTITPSTPVADILEVLGQAGLSQSLTQVVPLQMTSVTTQQPFTYANGMATSELHTS